MIKLTLSEFLDLLKAQKVPKEQLSFQCPVCKTHQTAQDLIDAGAGATFEDVEKYLAFSCVGRWTNAGEFKEGREGLGCNWTLGGFFQLHELEVTAPEGEVHPRFLPSNYERVNDAIHSDECR